MMWQLSTCLPLKDPKFPNSEVVFISLSSSDTSQLQSPLCTKTSKTAPIEMKRKKWSELEEQTLLTKYSELMSSGTLSKLKTREKKFRPIADHVNAVHHLQDPFSFPFKWSWRDVSIKVQNMRHQYLGVKQKIRTSKNEFNWKDGENHWENFLKYKEVFGDVELEVKNKKLSDSCGTDLFKDCGDLNFGIDSEDLEEEEEDDDDDAEEEEEDEEEEEEEGDNGDDDNAAGEEDGKFAREKSNGEMNGDQKEKVKKGFGRKRRLGLLGAQVIELRDTVMRTEYKRREWNFNRDKCMLEREEKRRELEFKRKMQQNEEEEMAENWEMELEARELMLARREFERRLRVEKELDEERRKRRIIEEKLEEEEMEWRERIVGMQIEHEKEMMQMHADACQNQIQIMGIFARIICQFFGSANDGLGSGLAGLPPQVLHNLQHPGGLGDGGKPDSNSPSEFI